MLPKKHRLKKKKEFERVFKEGKAAKKDLLFIRFLKNNLETTRFGFIVSKKISKKAVVRNKVKRRLREAAREMLPKIKPGYDIVVVAQRGIEKLNFFQIKDNLKELLKKIDLQ
ncbi:ribonuclease P protein component [bacterium]|nr:ribonuclease P protein component [bacterium]